MVDIRTVGVIGAGQMGSGIAHVCALAGYQVRLNDLSRERIDAGIGMIERNLGRQAARGVIEDGPIQDAMSRIQPAESLADIGSADLAIEAATENEAVKKDIFNAL